MATALLAMQWLGSTAARAHELQVDELRLWRTPSGDALRGQLTFDPELTRAPGEELAPGQASRRVKEFVRRQLDIETNGQLCELDVELRELYIPGGAVGGDVVSLGCQLTSPLDSVTVGVGKEFPALIVLVAGFTSERDGSDAVVVSGRSRSPTFRRQNLDGPAAPGTGVLARHGAQPPPWYRVALQFFSQGLRHVLPQGRDHVLFVVALTLGSSRTWRALLLELSAFTLAHTVTFALGALSLVAGHSRAVEPLIALSIAAMALSNLFTSARRRWRVGLALGFGLVHGLGFASALAAFALPSQTVLAALAGFNLGVEAAQLAVVAAVLGLAWALARFRVRPEPVVRLSSIAIGLVGLWWAVERVLTP